MFMGDLCVQTRFGPVRPNGWAFSGEASELSGRIGLRELGMARPSSCYSPTIAVFRPAEERLQRVRSDATFASARECSSGGAP
jgi:hypothetical protein